MRKTAVVVLSLICVACFASVSFSAYHHMGDTDSDRVLDLYPELAGTKLDNCALCHTGGQYEKRPGRWISMGSCQWCHHTYGYDESGEILDTLNPYGIDYLEYGRNQQALAAIADFDSDEDTYSNAVEIGAIRYPGDASDDPSQTAAPHRIYTREELAALPQHTQFLLMNTNKSGDGYTQYSGVPAAYLLQDAGLLAGATGITVFAPDGWSQYHPLTMDEDPELYHIMGSYPEAVYHYAEQADVALNPDTGWCDYSAPSNAGRVDGETIEVEDGLRAILAIEREGETLAPGELSLDNRLDGEGPYRLVVPQKSPSPPDQASTAEDQAVIWPYNENWDHNAGACTKSVTIIRVEPLPEGTTDIDLLEAGWDYIDEEKVIVYGAIAGAVPDAEPLEYEEVAAIDTHGARSWESFTIGGVPHLAAANQTGYSAIYRWNGVSFREIQQIEIPWAEGFESFVIGGETYLAMALNRNADDTSRLTDSIIYRWNGSSFEAYQRIPSMGARDWERFAIDGVMHLALANERNDDTRNVDSVIYRWDDARAVFVEAQVIPTKGARDWESFVIEGVPFLAVANQEDSDKDKNKRDIDSIIYRWDGTEFVRFQAIPTHAARDWESLTIDGTPYLAVANNQMDKSRAAASKIYGWNGTDFSEIQSVLTYGAHDWSSFTAEGETYLIVANNKTDETPSVDSDILMWNGSAFSEVASIPTQGVRDWEAFTLDGRTYLAAANDDDEYEEVNILSRIYRIGEAPVVDDPEPPEEDDDEDDNDGEDDNCFIQSLFR